MLKYIVKSFILLWLFTVGVVFAQEQVNPTQLPQLTQYVSDFANTLSANQLSELNALAEEYDTKTTNQLVTVVFPHRQWNELIDIAMKIFKDNQIGQEKADNGLLFVVAAEEKKIRILVWYWLEWIYPDLMASQVIEDVRPLVNSGDFYWAIKLFYERSQQILGWETPEWYTKPENNDAWYILCVFLWFFAGIFFMEFLLKKLKKKKKKPHNKISPFNIFKLFLYVSIGLISIVLVWLISLLAAYFLWFFVLWSFFSRFMGVMNSSWSTKNSSSWDSWWGFRWWGDWGSDWWGWFGGGWGDSWWGGDWD